MQTDTDTIPPGPDDPEAQAREAVEAMRALGGSRPEVERAILAVGEAHARKLAELGFDPEWMR